MIFIGEEFPCHFPMLNFDCASDYAHEQEAAAIPGGQGLEMLGVVGS